MKTLREEIVPFVPRGFVDQSIFRRRSRVDCRVTPTHSLAGRGLRRHVAGDRIDAAIARADELNDGPDLFAKQVTWALIALPALALSLAIPYRTWKPISHLLFAASLPLLIVVLFMEKRGGARCWIQFGYFDLQPSEIVKLTFILVLAQYLMYRDNIRQMTGLVAPFMITLDPVGVDSAGTRPGFGDSLFVPVLFAMLFAAGIRWQTSCVYRLPARFDAVSPLFWLKNEQRATVANYVPCFRRWTADRIPAAIDGINISRRPHCPWEDCGAANSRARGSTTRMRIGFMRHSPTSSIAWWASVGG